MEEGTVIDPILPGRIQPDAGHTVFYALGAISGSFPDRGDRVRFQRFMEGSDWASSVEVIA